MHLRLPFKLRNLFKHHNSSVRLAFKLNFFRIRRAGYPIRHTFAAFVDRYHMLVRGLPAATRHKVKEASHIIAGNSISDKDWQLGHTKVFLKVKSL